MTLYQFGGSSAGGILGISKWKTPLDVYNEVRLGVKREAGLAAELGTFLEPFVLRKYALEMGVELSGARTVYSDKYEWLCVHLDALAESSKWKQKRRVVEAKTSTVRLAHEWSDEPDGVSMEYVPQIQLYLHATGLQFCDVPMLLGNEKFKTYTVEADSEFQEMMLAKCDEFYRNHLLPGIPPPPSTADERINETRKVFPIDNGEIVQATAFGAEATFAWRASHSALKAATILEKDSKSFVIEAIGKNAGLSGVLPDGKPFKVTYKLKAGSESVDWEAVAKEANVSEDIIRRHTTRGNPHRAIHYAEGKTK